MKIGMIGSGRIGGTLAKLFARNGHEVALSNSRGPETLRGLAQEAGENVRATSVEEAAEHAEVAFVAIPLRAYLELPADPFQGRIVVDASNYYPSRDGHVEELDDGTSTSSELLARHLPAARVVKAFNTLNFEVLAAEGRPGAAREERIAVCLSGDDEEAKRVVAGLIDELGFAPVDAGALATGGRRQQPDSPVYGTVMLAPDAEAALRDSD